MRWYNIQASAKSILVIDLAFSPAPYIVIAQQRRVSRIEKLRLLARWGVRRAFVTAPYSKILNGNVIPLFDYLPTSGIVTGLFNQESKHLTLRLLSSLWSINPSTLKNSKSSFSC